MRVKKDHLIRLGASKEKIEHFEENFPNGIVWDKEGIEEACKIWEDFAWYTNQEGAYPLPDLTGADLGGAKLSMANLAGVTMTAANLFAAKLRWANLSGAKLSGTCLMFTDFTCANLSGCDLMTAFTYKTNMTSANLSGAELRYVDMTEVAQ